MKVAFGLKPHSGWAALVVLGEDKGELVVVERTRMELVEPNDIGWAKQPYHAAEDLEPAEARKLVERAIQSARRLCLREIMAAIARTRNRGHDVTACAVLMGAPMPEWTTEQILAVHIRMHKAEGVLFRNMLARAATESGVKLVEIPEKKLEELAQKAVGDPSNTRRLAIDQMKRSIGPPWGKDQKDAALAALIAYGFASKPINS